MPTVATIRSDLWTIDGRKCSDGKDESDGCFTVTGHASRLGKFFQKVGQFLGDGWDGSHTNTFIDAVNLIDRMGTGGKLQYSRVSRRRRQANTGN